MTSIYSNSLTFTATSAINGSNPKNNNTQTGGNSFDVLLGNISAGTGQKSVNSATAKENTDQLLQYIQQMVSNTQDFLMHIGSNDATTHATSAATDPFAISGIGSDESFVTGSGPLPAFLAKVDAQYHLNATQSKALRDIAIQFKDATKSPDTIQKIADALQQAGIVSPKTSAT